MNRRQFLAIPIVYGLPRSLTSPIIDGAIRVPFRYSTNPWIGGREVWQHDPIDGSAISLEHLAFLLDRPGHSCYIKEESWLNARIIEQKLGNTTKSTELFQGARLRFENDGPYRTSVIYWFDQILDETERVW